MVQILDLFKGKLTKLGNKIPFDSLEDQQNKLVKAFQDANATVIVLIDKIDHRSDAEI